ncbi:hypothetical protein HanPI659440_Chr10g0400771 [Helianthus annuus]|nr:hypothetical protein HanPI659440_Chr10g0400771 [Helianthus annuus]
MERLKLGEISIEDLPSVLKLRNELCLAHGHTPDVYTTNVFVWNAKPVHRTGIKLVEN